MKRKHLNQSHTITIFRQQTGELNPRARNEYSETVGEASKAGHLDTQQGTMAITGIQLDPVDQVENIASPNVLWDGDRLYVDVLDFMELSAIERGEATMEKGYYEEVR